MNTENSSLTVEEPSPVHKVESIVVVEPTANANMIGVSALDADSSSMISPIPKGQLDASPSG